MKSVLISIQPKWCELIANGKKTIELRKTKPKIQIPFKCYIYCTLSGSNNFFHTTLKSDIAKWNTGNWGNRKGNVIGEFICKRIDEYTAEFVEDENCYESIREIFEEDGEEDYCTITSNEGGNPDICYLCEMSCLSFKDIKKYIGINFHEKKFYGWRISELIIYDEPKELSEFMTLGALSFEELQEDVCNYCRPTQRGEIKMSHGSNGVYMCEGRFCDDAYKTYLEEEFSLKRPPQSWCYVEEVS